MQFNDLLRSEGIDPKDVIVLRHHPKERKLRDVLPWLVGENHDLFNAYQQTQGKVVEKAMLSAKFVASFIGDRAGRAVFVGLYKIKDHTPLSLKQYWEEPLNVELKTRYGVKGKTDNSSPTLWFDLVLTTFHEEWIGKLVVCWPGTGRSWWRWADRNEFQVHAVTEDSLLVREMPRWDRLVLSWNELEFLPKEWRAVLSQWRGIYFILDESDGKGYVGAAYGKDNLLGRWRSYAYSGHGGNKRLHSRNPHDFVFSILQIVAHDMEAEDVQSLEKSWKDRLHTRTFGLNDN
jgi:hypothetical protein